MKVYLSHPIRGSKGNNATNIEMQKNCDAALALGNVLKAKFPNLDFYVPASSEPFVRLAYEHNYLTIQDILKIDCMIIDTCDMVIVYTPEGGELCGGCDMEYDHAIENDIPVCIFRTIAEIESWLTCMLVGS